MAFQHRVLNIDVFKVHQFVNVDTGDSIKIVPEKGGMLLDLTLKNTSLLDACEDAKEIEKNPWYKNVFLYPFPNRLEDGYYEWEGKARQFTINDASTNNALHGFGEDEPMRITHIALGEERVEVNCAYNYVGYLKAYPFKFQIDILYRLDTTKGLSIQMSLTNRAKHNIPLGLGWHPYFKIAPCVEDCSLQLPSCQLIEIDNRMLPTGNKRAYTQFSQMTRINKTQLDNGFLLNSYGEKAVVKLQSDQGLLRYWQQTGVGQCNYLQVFTPPSRESIAIEPMTCNINAFNNGEGLITLAPNRQAVTQFGVHWQPA